MQRSSNNHTCVALLIVAIAAATSVSVATFCDAKSSYRSNIPNGGSVVRNGVPWSGVGHTTTTSGPVNAFGSAFASAGHTWTVALCLADTDGDGYTNGMELGDPNCVWTMGATPSRTTDISHPAFADSFPATVPSPGGSPRPTPPPPAVTPPPGPATPGVTLPPSATPMYTAFPGVMSLDWRMDNADTKLRGKLTVTAGSSYYASFGVSSSGMIGNLVLCHFPATAAAAVCHDYVGSNWAVTRGTAQLTTVTASSRSGTGFTVDFEINARAWGVGARGGGAQRVIFAHGPMAAAGYPQIHPSGATNKATIDFYTNAAQNNGGGDDDDDDAGTPVSPPALPQTAPPSSPTGGTPSPASSEKTAAFFVAEVLSSRYSESSFKQFLAANIANGAAISASDVVIEEVTQNVDTGVATVKFMIWARDAQSASALQQQVAAIPPTMRAAAGISGIQPYQTNVSEESKRGTGVWVLFVAGLCAALVHPAAFASVTTLRFFKPMADLPFDRLLEKAGEEMSDVRNEEERQDERRRSPQQLQQQRRYDPSAASPSSLTSRAQAPSYHDYHPLRPSGAAMMATTTIQPERGFYAPPRLPGNARGAPTSQQQAPRSPRGLHEQAWTEPARNTLVLPGKSATNMYAAPPQPSSPFQQQQQMQHVYRSLPYNNSGGNNDNSFRDSGVDATNTHSDSSITSHSSPRGGGGGGGRIIFEDRSPAVRRSNVAPNVSHGAAFGML